MNIEKIVQELIDAPLLNYGPHGRTKRYTVELKAAVGKYIVDNNLAYTGASKLFASYGINVDVKMLSVWTRKYTDRKTGYQFGQSVRYDVKTKCLVVKDALESRKTRAVIAFEIGITEGTLYRWISLYKDDYMEYIDAPGGIPYIVKNKKMVDGEKAILSLKDLLIKQKKELEEELRQKISIIDEDLEILAKAEEIKNRMQ